MGRRTRKRKEQEQEKEEQKEEEKEEEEEEKKRHVKCQHTLDVANNKSLLCATFFPLEKKKNKK